MRKSPLNYPKELSRQEGGFFGIVFKEQLVIQLGWSYGSKTPLQSQIWGSLNFVDFVLLSEQLVTELTRLKK